MGVMIDGEWHDYEDEQAFLDGEFIQKPGQFRHQIERPVEPEPEPEPELESEDEDLFSLDDAPPQEKPEPKPQVTEPLYGVEAGRYHLYASLACPWSHRCLIMHRLKKLERVVGLTILEPSNLEQGWEFAFIGRNRLRSAGASADPLFSAQYLHQLYHRSDPNYSGRVTVPMLWDKKTRTIVNNESSDIMRMFNSLFNDITNHPLDFYPPSLQTEIDALNLVITKTINQGVYLCGFASMQAAYDQAVNALFDALDTMNERLEHKRYLHGDQLTESDWLLFTTLVRFDAVYFSLFKTNRKRIEDYPNLAQYVRELYQIKGVSETVNFEHIIRYHYISLGRLNPSRIEPIGFYPNYSDFHHRGV
jgi:putative glutathione S-transferase